MCFLREKNTNMERLPLLINGTVPYAHTHPGGFLGKMVVLLLVWWKFVTMVIPRGPCAFLLPHCQEVVCVIQKGKHGRPKRSKWPPGAGCVYCLKCFLCDDDWYTILGCLLMCVVSRGSNVWGYFAANINVLCWYTGLYHSLVYIV